MRRALRPQLPSLAFFYGLHWDDHLVNMPPAEIQEHVEQIETFVRLYAVVEDTGGQ